MSRHRKDPLRPLTADERQELTRLSRSLSAPAAQVERSRALLAIADGASYTAAAHQVGRRHNETISAWVSRFNRDGLAAVRPGHGGGPRIRYGADAQQRILAEWARTPQREQDGTATWSLSLLQRALRQADDGLPRVSTFTIWRTLHAGGLSWQKSRTWCETGVVMRQRKHGVVRVSDPDAMAKKIRSCWHLAVPRRPGRHPGCGGSGCAGPGMPPVVKTLAECGPSLPADPTQLAHSGWAQPRRRGRDQAHLPTEHGGRGGRLAPAARRSWCAARQTDARGRCWSAAGRAPRNNGTARVCSCGPPCGSARWRRRASPPCRGAGAWRRRARRSGAGQGGRFPRPGCSGCARPGAPSRRRARCPAIAQPCPPSHG